MMMKKSKQTLMVAGLTLLAALQTLADGKITSLKLVNNTADITFSSTPGGTYQIQSSDNFMTGSWSDSGTPVIANAEETTVSTDSSEANSYYRVIKLDLATFIYGNTIYPQAPYLSTWGLGSEEDSYVTNDRNYDWYIDQKYTGEYADNNCGPSAVTMAIKWYDESFTQTAEEARNWRVSGGGWWYTSDITAYLKKYNVPYSTKRCNGPDHIEQLLSEGKIMIICYTTAKIPSNDNAEERLDRFYSYRGGHFAVVKGARRVSGELFLELYDPNNWDATYADGSRKGENRHYNEIDLDSAISSWWDYLIVIDPPATTTSSTFSTSSLALDPFDVDETTIPDAWGK